MILLSLVFYYSKVNIFGLLTASCNKTRPLRTSLWALGNTDFFFIFWHFINLMTNCLIKNKKKNKKNSSDESLMKIISSYSPSGRTCLPWHFKYITRILCLISGLSLHVMWAHWHLIFRRPMVRFHCNQALSLRKNWLFLTPPPFKNRHVLRTSSPTSLGAHDCEVYWHLQAFEVYFRIIDRDGQTVRCLFFISTWLLHIH